MKLVIEQGGETQTLTAQEGKSVLELFRENGIFVPAICGGHGTCGKCRIRYIEESEQNHERDGEHLLHEQEICLACKTFPVSDSRIQVLEAETSANISTKYWQSPNDEQKSFQVKNLKDTEQTYHIAIDIGTTTVAGMLLEEYSNIVLASRSRMNRQRIYGADVISRIQASNTGKLGALQECIRTDLKEIIVDLMEDSGMKREAVTKIVLDGNTTMIHLLMGYSCETLGVAPFSPVNLEPIYGTCEDLLGFETWTCRVFILPGISAFVGGDITAGLLATDFMHSVPNNLLLDLGTNGEMAVGNRNQIWVASAAAGPAFEGGNITYGTGSIAGAICHAYWLDGEMRLETIGNVYPITGICGTGALELLSELLEANLVDETGLMASPYFKEGYPLGRGKTGEHIRFMQKDIRELQLAKAAIRAGIETLVKVAAMSFSELDTIYLAGSFGGQLDVNKAIRIGLLPEEFRGKVKTVGNSALYGAVQYVKNKEYRQYAADIIKTAKEVTLAKTEIFQNLYLDYINF